MTPEDLIIAIRNDFEKRISEKSTWGKNEIMIQLNMAIMMIALKTLKDINVFKG